MKKPLILAALLGSSAYAADLSLKECLIQEPVPGKNMTGAFFTVENSGKDTVKLTAAAIEKIDAKFEIHEMIHKDGKMEMSEIQSYDITPGEHRFKKGGYHIMLMNLKNAPKAGETYPMNLTLDNGETLNCEAKVLSVEDTIKHFKPEDQHGHGHDKKAQEHSKDGEKSAHKH